MGQSQQSIHFLAIGDWGMDTDHEKSNGTQMAKIFENHDNVDNFFVVALGDNFYETGVDGTDDPKWVSIFSEPFKDVKCPWYPVLGNHDWEGNAQAQLDFCTDKRWQMNDIYYTRTFGQVQMIFIDTTMLCPEISSMFTSKEFPKEMKEKHMKWLDKTLKSSTYEWILVFGHYPVYSGGGSGIMGEMQDVNTLLSKYQNVTAYFAGHDHNLQHLYCSKSEINYFVSGSGCESTHCKSLTGYTVFGVPIEGFMSCTLKNNVLNVKFVSYEGNELYSVDVQKRVKKIV